MRPGARLVVSAVLSITVVSCLSANAATEATYGPASSQAAATSASSSGETGGVWVLPFPAPAGETLRWVGRSVQRVLAADWTRGARTGVTAPAKAPAADDVDTAL